MTPFPPRFFSIKIVVRFRKQFFDALPIAAIDGDADTHRERGVFLVVGHDFTDAIRDTAGFVFLCFGQDKSKFVAAIAGGSINGTTMNTENTGKAAERAAAN